jgi:hypothetical protein
MGSTASLSTAAMTAQAGATALSAYGSYQQGQFDSKIDLFNADIADLQARDAFRRGAQAELKLRKDVRLLGGQQIASFAGQGVDIGSAVVADVAADNEMQMRQDIQRIKNNAALESWGYQVAGANERAKAAMASSAATGKAIGTLLGGAATGAYYYSQISKPTTVTSSPATYYVPAGTPTTRG